MSWLMSASAATAALMLAGCTVQLPGPPSAAKPVITTVVGTGTAGYNGDGLDGVDTNLYLPQDATVSPDGDLYFPDWNNHRLRRVVDGKVETFAGTGELGDAKPGDAIYAQFNHPTNLEFDQDGKVIVAAWHNSKVMRIDLTTGELTTIAGTGKRAFSGDEGPAAMADLDLPSSVVINSIGDILISDQANFRIRQVEPTGVIHTICGDGTPAYSGDGGRAETAQLNSPKGQSAAPAGRIALTANDEIIIADTGNHVVRKIDGAGIVTTLAGTGVAGFSGDGGPGTTAQLNTPSDVAVGPDGSIYIADTMNFAVRKLSPDGTISTYAGTGGERGFEGDGGPADEAKLDRPYGVATAPNGDLYVADTHNHRIRRISSTLPAGYDPNAGGDGTRPVEIIPCTNAVGSICTFAGTGETGFKTDGLDPLHTILYWPLDMEFTQSGRVIMLDWNNHKVREILSDNTVKTIMGSDFVGDGPPDPDGAGPLPFPDLVEPGAEPLTVSLNHPTDIQEFPNGDVLIVAWHNHKLRQIDVDTGRVLVVSGAGAVPAPVGMPGPGDGGVAKDARYNQPAHAVLDPNGNLFLVDQRNQRIRVLYNFAEDRDQATVGTVVGTGNKGFNADGLPGLMTDVSFPAGGNPEPTGGLALDAAGNLYFSDTQNNRIRKVEFLNDDFTESIVTTVAGTGEAGYSGDGGLGTAAKIANPEDIEVGPDGNIYFADTDNNAVRRIDSTTGIIDTVAGTGVKGYSGDGGPAINAQLDRPFGVAFDGDGNLFISDTFNSRIRKVTLTR